MVIGTSDGVWQQRVSAYDNGDGRRWLFVFDGGDGRLLWHQWTIVVTMLDDVGDGLRQGNGEAKMAGTVASVDNRYGVQYGIGDGLRQGNGEAKMAGTVRGREGGARRPKTNRHNERTIGGKHNQRSMRDDGTTSWRDETMRGRHGETMGRQEGGTTRRRDDERAARQEATQHTAGTTRGQEGGTTRG
jgi:hypothetical protein